MTNGRGHNDGHLTGSQPRNLKMANRKAICWCIAAAVGLLVPVIALVTMDIWINAHSREVPRGQSLSVAGLPTGSYEVLETGIMGDSVRLAQIVPDTLDLQPTADRKEQKINGVVWFQRASLTIQSPSAALIVPSSSEASLRIESSATTAIAVVTIVGGVLVGLAVWGVLGLKLSNRRAEHSTAVSASA